VNADGVGFARILSTFSLIMVSPLSRLLVLEGDIYQRGGC
jgi:hypothetical protein